MIERGMFIRSTTLDWEGMVLGVAGEGEFAEAEVAFLVPGTPIATEPLVSSGYGDIDMRRVTVRTLRVATDVRAEQRTLALGVLSGRIAEPADLDARQRMLLGVWRPYDLLLQQEFRNAAEVIIQRDLAALDRLTAMVERLVTAP